LGAEAQFTIQCPGEGRFMAPISLKSDNNDGIMINYSEN
jgi:hypothetical protein